MELTEIRKKLKKELDKDRYEHTKGVMYTAGCLAMAYEYPIEKAMLAGLLHDCAKCIPNDEKISICRENHVIISNVELENPYLLHAKAICLWNPWQGRSGIWRLPERIYFPLRWLW